MCPRICVLGHTREQAIYLLDLLCKYNPDDIYRRRVDVGIMNDGTELIALSITEDSKFKGRHFDYVFYEEGKIAYYCIHHGSAMEYITQRCLSHSEAPQEFQWSKISTSIN